MVLAEIQGGLGRKDEQRAALSMKSPAQRHRDSEKLHRRISLTEDVYRKLGAYSKRIRELEVRDPKLRNAHQELLAAEKKLKDLDI